VYAKLNAFTETHSPKTSTKYLQTLKFKQKDKDGQQILRLSLKSVTKKVIITITWDYFIQKQKISGSLPHKAKQSSTVTYCHKILKLYQADDLASPAFVVK